MTVSISPLAKQQFNQNGIPLAGGKLFTYAAGTTTKLTTYTNSTGGTPNTNPILLDANGQCDIWLTDGLLYKYVLAPATDTDPPTNPFWTEDNVTPTDNAANAITTALAASGGAALIGFEAPGSTVVTTVAAALSDVVNVKRFGAVPDGATDSTTAIANAVAALTNGQALYFPGGPGAYLTNTQVKVNQTNVRIYGDGPSSVLMAKGGAALGELLWINGANTIVENMVLDGNRAAVGMSNTLSYVFYASASHVKVRGVEVRFGTRYGIAWGAASATEDYEFSGCYIHDNGGVLNSAGIGIGMGAIGSAQPSDTRIVNNHFENNYNTVTQPNDSGAINGAGFGVTCTGNYCLNNYNVNGGAIAINGGNPQGQFNVIANNVVQQTSTFGSDQTAGIEVDGSNTVVNGNVMQGMTSDGIRLEGTSSGCIVSNNVIQCAAIGINLINSGGTGVQFTRISDNSILQAATGIQLQTTSGGAVFAENNYIATGVTTKVSGITNFALLRNNYNFNGTTPGINVTTPAMQISGNFVTNNTGVDCFVYVVSGTSNVGITLTGAGLITTVPSGGQVGVVYLQAGCSISLTYSALPNSWKWAGN